MGPSEQDQKLMLACLRAAQEVWERHTRFGAANESITAIALAFYAQEQERRAQPTTKRRN